LKGPLFEADFVVVGNFFHFSTTLTPTHFFLFQLGILANQIGEMAPLKKIKSERTLLSLTRLKITINVRGVFQTIPE
jgi:hypothetical protein